MNIHKIIDGMAEIINKYKDSDVVDVKVIKGMFKELQGREHKLNFSLYNRLYNWKFTQAKNYLKGEPDNVVEMVWALSDMFGDCGWGIEGNMNVIINGALKNIGVEDE